MSFLRLRDTQDSRSGARSLSPPTDTDRAEDILAQLSLMDGGGAEDDSYSMLDGPSVDGAEVNRSVGLRTSVGGRGTAVTAGSGGYGGESTFSTPLLGNNISRFPQSGGGFRQDQGAAARRIQSRASPSLQGGRARSSPTPSFDGNSRLLRAVFVDDDFLATKCCGFIGSSGLFCLRDKIEDRGLASCQTRNHAESKFQPIVDSFYAPTGNHYNVPTANSVRSVHINDLTRIMQAKFSDSLFTKEGWDKEFLEAKREIKRRTPPTGPPGVVETTYQGGRDDTASLAFLSTRGSLASVDRPDEEDVLFPWEDGVDVGSAEVAVEMQRIALHDLRESVGRRFGEIQDALREIAAKVVREEMGGLAGLIAQHGSMEAVIEEITDSQLRVLHQCMQTEWRGVESRLAGNQTAPDLTRIFRRYVLQSARREAKLEQRLQDVERAIAQGGGVPNAGPDLRGEVTVTIAGQEIPVSMVSVARQVFELQQRIEVLDARAKHSGVSVGDYSFASEAEFQAFLTTHDPSGNLLAGCVDPASLSQGFGSGENLTTQEFLTTSQQSHRVNLRMGEAAFGASFNVRYPKWLVKTNSGARLASSTTVDMLKSWPNWIGNGHMGDGHKDSISQMFEQACLNHRQYVEDAGVPDELKKLALLTADLSNRWWVELSSYLDNEYLMLHSYKLATEQILLLLSNQVAQMFEDIYETRVPAANTDITQRSTAAVRYAWVTLRAHTIMAAYRDVKFRDHPAIAGTFIRFLTRNLADQSSMSLKQTVTDLDKELKKLRQDLDKKLNVTAFNSFENKITSQLKEKK